VKDGNLVITQTNNEDNVLMHGIALIQCTPIIALDMWEHSYMLQYLGAKGKEAYVDNFWLCVDWEKVSANFEKYNLDGFKVAPLLP